MHPFIFVDKSYSIIYVLWCFYFIFVDFRMKGEEGGVAANTIAKEKHRYDVMFVIHVVQVVKAKEVKKKEERKE